MVGGQRLHPADEELRWLLCTSLEDDCTDDASPLTLEADAQTCFNRDK